MEVILIADVQKTYALVLGAVLVLLGLVGFVNHPVLGLFGVNVLQNIVHLAGGAAIIWFGYKAGAAKSTNMWLGIAGVLLAVLWFIPGTGGDLGLLSQLFGINAAISYLHLGVGIVSLAVAYGVKEGAVTA